jgi:hypothetical protein
LRIDIAMIQSEGNAPKLLNPYALALHHQNSRLQLEAALLRWNILPLTVSFQSPTPKYQTSSSTAAHRAIDMNI